MTDPAEEIRRALSQHLPVSDDEFDALYRDDLRPRARSHGSPMEVILRAGQLLEPATGERILDVGSGVGKVCLVGALSFPGTWFGIEHDRAQVTAANELSRRLGVADWTCFIRGDLDSIEWWHFDGIYLYNPPGSVLVERHADPRHAPAEAAAIVERIVVGLGRARPGVRVVTYDGFGGAMPAGYEQVTSEQIHGGDLRMYTKRPRRRRSLGGGGGTR